MPTLGILNTFCMAERDLNAAVTGRPALALAPQPAESDAARKRSELFAKVRACVLSEIRASNAPITLRSGDDQRFDPADVDGLRKELIENFDVKLLIGESAPDVIPSGELLNLLIARLNRILQEKKKFGSLVSRGTITLGMRPGDRHRRIDIGGAARMQSTIEDQLGLYFNAQTDGGAQLVVNGEHTAAQDAREFFGEPQHGAQSGDIGALQEAFVRDIGRGSVNFKSTHLRRLFRAEDPAERQRIFAQMVSTFSRTQAETVTSDLFGTFGDRDEFLVYANGSFELCSGAALLTRSLTGMPAWMKFARKQRRVYVTDAIHGQLEAGAKFIKV